MHKMSYFSTGNDTIQHTWRINIKGAVLSSKIKNFVFVFLIISTRLHSSFQETF